MVDGTTVCMCCFSFDYKHIQINISTVGPLVNPSWGVSVAVTSGSHLFVKDLAPFKLLFPFSRPILYTKLSCHWWHQMTSIIAYSSRSKDGLQYMLVKRTVLSHPPPPQHYEFMLHAIRMYCCLMTFIHTLHIQHTDMSKSSVPVSVIFKHVDNVKCDVIILMKQIPPNCSV